MASEFWALGAIISVDFPAPPRSLQVWYGPASYYPESSRQLFHETVHFWQYLASGYLTRLVEEDWNRMFAFEQTGKITREATRRLHFVSQHPEHGFSPRDLAEAFARYWDVHVIGPPSLIELELRAGRHAFSPEFVERLETLKANDGLWHPESGGYSSASFDLAMEGPGGGWAKPYVWLCQKLPPRATAALFPVAAHLAFQTTDPVSTFAFFLTAAKSLEEMLARVPSGQDIALMWRMCVEICYPMLRDDVPKEKVLGTAIRVVASGSLNHNPIWRWLTKYMHYAAANMSASGEGIDRDTAVRRGMATLAYVLTCPGDPKARGWLVPLLAPPLVQFADGVEWNPARDAAATLHSSFSEIKTLDRIAELARQMKERWRRFIVASRGY